MTKKVLNLPTYSVVIPVYNSNRSLQELADRLNTVFTKELNDTFEIIFVDDCSVSQETWKMLSELANQHAFIRAFRLAKNFGQGGALLCGMSKARGGWIITMDDDLQHYPEDIPLLLRRREHDVVIGRFLKKHCGYFKKLTSKIKSHLDVKLLGMPRNIISTPFKLIKKRVVDNMLLIHTPRPFMPALILAVTSDIVNVEVRHETRKFGQSNYNLLKSISLISNMLFNNSSSMLRMMSLLGFWLASLSFFYGLVLFIRKILYQSVFQGWTSLMVTVLFSTGAIIFCLGVLGEYIFRVIEISETRPNFLIKEEVDLFEKKGT